MDEEIKQQVETEPSKLGIASGGSNSPDEQKMTAQKSSIFKSKRRVVVIVAIATMALAAILATAYVLRKSDNKITRDDQGQIISRADHVQPHGESHVPEGAKNYTPQELIAENEQKIANLAANYETYLALAQLYASQGNTQKAIENYELASQKADPNMAGYKTFIEGNEASIKTLKAN